MEKEKSSMRVVYDTNVLISALQFGGKPRAVFLYAVNKQADMVSSPALILELTHTLKQKFRYADEPLIHIISAVRNVCEIVHPVHTLHVLSDEPDNRVLEAAVEGKCEYVVTGDKALLALGEYKKIRVITVDEFYTLAKK